MDTYDGYGRVSRVGGREGESFGSPGEQESVCRGWVAEAGYQFGLWVFEQDVSGTKPATKREVERLIRRVESGVSRGLVVGDFSRLTREDDWAAVSLVGRVVAAGGRVVGVDDNYDSADEYGAL